MEGTPKAIEIKGITRNATKIGVQDGQAEDLINLRFMDGSWRASGDGRLIDFTTYMEYTQLYVHTNVYHHLLGVHEDPSTNVRTLYWFAEIGDDGVTFYPLDGSSRTSWPANMQDLPTAPVALTTVVGDLTITQTGHMLTIIDEADSFEFLVFKTGDQVYVKPITDNLPDSKRRDLYPFGQVNFNFYAPKPDLLFQERTIGLYTGQDNRIYKEEDFVTKQHPYLCFKQLPTNGTIDELRAIVKGTFGEIEENNVFSRPLLVCAAVKLYDGSYAYASNPVLIYPRQQSSAKRLYKKEVDGNIVFDNFEDCAKYEDMASHYPTSSGVTQDQEGVYPDINFEVTVDESDHYKGHAITRRAYSKTVHYSTGYNLPSIDITNRSEDVLPSLLHCYQSLGSTAYYVALLGYDLVMSISDFSILEKNKDIFQSLCVFITPEVQNYDVDHEFSYITASFLHRPSEDIIYDLMHSPMFLLKEYTIGELNFLKENKRIDLSAKEDENILTNITQQPQLPIEATSRTTYLPKVSYMYNNRLHIANYKAYPFFGYPLDLFHLHNHSVKVQSDSYFKGVLPNLADNSDDYLQFQKTSHNFPSTIPSGCTYFAFIEVTIDSSQGEQTVVRYIQPYDTTTAVNGRADFIEDLNPLITYPDARAKHIKIVRYDASLSSSRTFEFDMKPHPYLNMAYHIDPNLKPISIAGSGITPAEPEPLPEMQNAEEYFPNGLKVSKADQPMYFPVENTYRVGSAEILALMSNAIAVGTGQTGAAPLYVFCKDGVYALFVDASGQMTYSNSRVLARDVCNNPRSVTPIDAGVVFTTDRGLMMIAGEQVEEIGQPAEGDVLKFADTTSGNKEFIKMANGALRKIADLPNMVTATDFLTYLTGAIINYNHNMRELMVSNPAYQYSYIMDRERNWSRRDYTAAEYVNNYPTSYRVVNIGTAVNPNIKFYRVDDEGDALSSLEQHKEADNHIFYLSNVIKLDSIGFKQAYRFVVRGYFETMPRPAVYGRFNDRDVYFVSDEFASYSAGSTITLENFAFGADYFKFYASPSADFPFIKYARIYDKTTLRDVTDVMGIGYYQDVIYSATPTISLTRGTMPTHVGIYVFGSYDGRKWALLGGKEKTGKFTDIGCKVERTDVKFFRICLAGQVTGKTRIDYMEMSADGSMLNTKIR